MDFNQLIIAANNDQTFLSLKSKCDSIMPKSTELIIKDTFSGQRCMAERSKQSLLNYLYYSMTVNIIMLKILTAWKSNKKFLNWSRTSKKYKDKFVFTTTNILVPGYSEQSKEPTLAGKFEIEAQYTNLATNDSSSTTISVKVLKASLDDVPFQRLANGEMDFGVLLRLIEPVSDIWIEQECKKLFDFNIKVFKDLVYNMAIAAS